MNYLRQNAEMVVFPNAKINIGLHILNKRTDGYHNLESVFYPIRLCDILEIQKTDRFQFTQTGLPIAGDSNQNLVVKAYRLLQNKYGIGPVSIHLHKVIPTGSGLGGGSSDGAFALKTLNELFGLGIPAEGLLDLALNLGSDCPFFIYNVPCRVTGRGEKLEKIEFDLRNFWIKVVHTGLHVSTRDAFEGINTNQLIIERSPINYADLFSIEKRIKNDFEYNIFPKYPILSDLEKKLYNEGAFYASMTGSGSAVYGFFEQEPGKTNPEAFEYIGRLNV